MASTGRRWHIVDVTEFVKVFQQSRTVKEVAKHFGLTTAGVYARACNIRRMGVPLKSFRVIRNNRRQIKYLKELAEKSYAV